MPESGADRYIPAGAPLQGLREAAQGCRGCELYRRATQVVFGEGPVGAALLLVGEQPGDAEDLSGRPFVGPAGRLLDRALRDAGIERRSVYVTNAVKHFRWIQRGKKRLHQKPRLIEIRACLPWLMAEIDRVRPSLTVCLGATAAQALLGSGFRVSRDRGRIFASESAGPVLATLHPSALLRAADADSRALEYGKFVEDLRRAARAHQT